MSAIDDVLVDHDAMCGEHHDGSHVGSYRACPRCQLDEQLRESARAELTRLRLIEKYAEALVKEIRSNGTAGEPEDTGEVYGSPTIESVIAECVVSDVEHALRSTARAALGGK